MYHTHVVHMCKTMIWDRIRFLYGSGTKNMSNIVKYTFAVYVLQVLILPS